MSKAVFLGVFLYAITIGMGWILLKILKRIEVLKNWEFEVTIGVTIIILAVLAIVLYFSS